MNLRSIDLNLLVILDALLDEAHVSRAANRLGLSQPAASAALQRCRDLFGDPLLVRSRGAMRLTPKAEALRAPLASLLSGVTALVDQGEPALGEIRARLRIAMADYPALVVVAPLLRDLRRTTPGIDLVFQPWQGGDVARQALVDGVTDLAVSVFPPADDLHREELLTEEYLIVLRAGHPAIDGFDLPSWLRYPHVVVSSRGDARGALDVELAARGLSRRVGLVVPSFQIVPDVLRESDMIAMLPSRVVAGQAGLVALPPPVPVPGFSLHLAWHRRRAADPALRHVAGLLLRLLDERRHAPFAAGISGGPSGTAPPG